MSFALDFRKRLQQKEGVEHARRKANTGFVTMPLETDADTRGNHRRALLAIVIAGLMLAVLNSGGLVNTAYNLADSRTGQAIIVATEKWHGLMEQGKTTGVLDHVRGSVAAMRETSWQDLKLVFNNLQGQVRDTAPDAPAISPEISPGSAPDQAPQKQETGTPEETAPKGPVMRASADLPQAQ